jgi:hypothetical protein
MADSPCLTCNPCDKKAPKDIVKDDILHGKPASDDRTGPLGAAEDAADPQPPVVARLWNLHTVDAGTSNPDPDSRLGAYKATAGYPPGTVGNSVHNAIGTIYTGFGTYMQEDIGKVFSSPQAKSLYNDPVTSSSSKCMAAIEQAYWAQVKAEDPWSAGGQLGSSFSPSARDWLQKNIFGSSPPSPTPASPPVTPWLGFP